MPSGRNGARRLKPYQKTTLQRDGENYSAEPKERRPISTKEAALKSVFHKLNIGLVFFLYPVSLDLPNQVAFAASLIRLNQQLDRTKQP